MVLKQVAYSIANNEYIWIRQDVAELRDNCPATGELHDLFTSVNAFLNTEGGDVFIGIIDDEENNCFVFKGYDHANKERVRLLPWGFTYANGQQADLSDHISFEMMPFLDGEVLAIHIQPVAGDQRPVYYRNTAWERLPSGNRKLSRLENTQSAEAISRLSVDESVVLSIPDDGMSDAISDIEFEEQSNTEQVPEEGQTNIDNFAASNIPATEENTTKDTEPSPAPEQPAVGQQIHTAFLISVFGNDFISLQPEVKQLLSWIHDKNTANTPPDLEELAHKLAALTNANTTLLPITEKNARKSVQQLEKNRFIIRRKGAGFSINNGYQVVQHLFN